MKDADRLDILVHQSPLKLGDRNFEFHEHGDWPLNILAMKIEFLLDEKQMEILFE